LLTSQTIKSNSWITDVGLVNLGQVLKKTSSVKRLTLVFIGHRSVKSSKFEAQLINRENGVTDKGVLALFQGIKDMTFLENLSLKFFS